MGKAPGPQGRRPRVWSLECLVGLGLLPYLDKGTGSLGLVPSVTFHLTVV